MCPMARAGPGSLLYRRNIKLDSFLKRNTERVVFERIQTYEPCVVKSYSINKIYMHVVLSDECLYLTEFSPRTLSCVFSFSAVRAIELINDLPDFLSGKDRDQSQHIKIVYVTEKPAANGQSNSHVFSPVHPSHSSRISEDKDLIYSSQIKGYAAQSLPNTFRSTRSASCPNQETLGLLVPHPPDRPHSSASMYPKPDSNQSTNNAPTGQVPRRNGIYLSSFLKRDKKSSEAELHLYALSPRSTLYLHLQSLWTRFIIKSTLMLDPLHRKKYCGSCFLSTGKRRPIVSWEQTALLFSSLNCELLQSGLSVETLYLLLQELHTSTHKNITIPRLFWRSNDLCLFLVQTLEDCLHTGHKGFYTTDQLLLSTLIVQTLAVMFSETEVEPARLHLLSANNGALASRMILALICDSEPQTQHGSKIKIFLAEYLDAACSLLFELLLLNQEMSRYSMSESILSIGWIFQVLQPHPHLLSFFGYHARQVVLSLSSTQESNITPVQSVLLFQRCRLLLASLQYCSTLSLHLKSHYREEFRYAVNVLSAEVRLPAHYPIRTMIQRLLEQIQTLILH